MTTRRCECCGGFGWIWRPWNVLPFTPKSRCLSCKGSGRVPDVRRVVGPTLFPEIEARTRRCDPRWH